MVVVTLVRLSASDNAGLSHAGHSSVACLLDLRALDRVSPLYDVVAYPLCLLQIAMLTNARKAYAFVGHNNARQMHQLMCGLNTTLPSSADTIQTKCSSERGAHGWLLLMNVRLLKELRRRGIARRTGCCWCDQLRYERLHINGDLRARCKLVCRDPGVKLAGFPADGARAKRNGWRQGAFADILPDGGIGTADLFPYLGQPENTLVRDSASADDQFLDFFRQEVAFRPLAEYVYCRLNATFHCDHLSCLSYEDDSGPNQGCNVRTWIYRLIRQDRV
jgi:hypothetical protein